MQSFFGTCLDENSSTWRLILDTDRAVENLIFLPLLTAYRKTIKFLNFLDHGSFLSLNIGSLTSSKVELVEHDLRDSSYGNRVSRNPAKLTLIFRETTRRDTAPVVPLLLFPCLESSGALPACFFTLSEIYTRRCMLQRRGNAFKSLFLAIRFFLRVTWQTKNGETTRGERGREREKRLGAYSVIERSILLRE